MLGTKAAQEAKFAEFAKAQNNAEYAAVVKNIDDLVAKTTPLNYQYTCLRETFFGAIEFGNVMLTKTREALLEKKRFCNRSTHESLGKHLRKHP